MFKSLLPHSLLSSCLLGLHVLAFISVPNFPTFIFKSSNSKSATLLSMLFTLFVWLLIISPFPVWLLVDDLANNKFDFNNSFSLCRSDKSLNATKRPFGPFDVYVIKLGNSEKKMVYAFLK